MRKNLIYLFIILFLFMPLLTVLSRPSLSYAQEKPERILTLLESIRLAMSNNQELLIVTEEEIIANCKIKLARSQRYPEIVLSGGYTNLKVDTPITLSPMLGGTTVDVGVSEYYSSHLSLRQFLYTGGYLSGITKEAKLNLQEVESDYRQIKRKIVLEVTKTFYEVLLNQEIVKIYEDALNQTKAILEIAREYVPSKGLYDYNLINAEVQLSLIEVSLGKARQDLEQARVVFNKSIGIELNTNIELKGELAYNEQQEFELNRSITRALQFSPELNKKKIQEQMYDVKVTRSKGKLYPSVIIEGDIAYSGEDFPPKGKSWAATLAVNFPIFDGWASFTRIKEAKSELRKTKLERVKLSDEIKLKVQQLHSNHERTKKAIKPLQQTQELCIKRLEIAMESFKKGNASLTEVLNAQMTLMQAQINYVQNLQAYLISKEGLNIIANPVD